MILGVLWVVTAVVVGFMLGRVSMYGLVLEGAEEEESERPFFQAGDRSVIHRGRGHRAVEEMKVWSVGSPVTGEVVGQGEGDHPVIVIRPDTDKLYAPASGKITRLFPMGNAFLFVTEFGAELYIQAGDMEDELLGRHYRPRIVQNEVVAKGKLLLEFDRQGLEAEGASAEVTVCVENGVYGGDVKMTAQERVKIGEEILQVREPAGRRAAG